MGHFKNQPGSMGDPKQIVVDSLNQQTRNRTEAVLAQVLTHYVLKNQQTHVIALGNIVNCT